MSGFAALPARLWERCCGAAWVDGVWVDGAWVDGVWVDGVWDDGACAWVDGACARVFASACARAISRLPMAFPFAAHSSMLSLIRTLIRLLCDWMAEPCSTMSIVINPYENKKRTVSNGSRLRFFFGTAIGITDV